MSNSFENIWQWQSVLLPSRYFPSPNKKYFFSSRKRLLNLPLYISILSRPYVIRSLEITIRPVLESWQPVQTLEDAALAMTTPLFVGDPPPRLGGTALEKDRAIWDFVLTNCARIPSSTREVLWGRGLLDELYRVVIPAQSYLVEKTR